MKKPSLETELRNTKRMLREAVTTNVAIRQQRDEYRARATKAEQESAEWRKRFDALLYREEKPNA